MDTNTAGIAAVAFSMIVCWVGVRAANLRIIAGSLVLLVFSLVLYLAGWRWAKELWFPCTLMNVHYRELIHYWTKEEVNIPRPPKRPHKPKR